MSQPIDLLLTCNLQYTYAPLKQLQKPQNLQTALNIPINTIVIILPQPLASSNAKRM